MDPKNSFNAHYGGCRAGKIYYPDTTVANRANQIKRSGWEQEMVEDF